MGLNSKSRLKQFHNDSLVGFVSYIEGIMRYFIIVRGVDTPTKRLFAQHLVRGLNRDVNHVFAIHLGLTLLGVTPTTNRTILRSADRTLKNRTKRVLLNSTEPLLVIDSESLRPANWRQFTEMAKSLNIDSRLIGIDVWSANDAVGLRLENLQRSKTDALKSDSHKYYDVKISDVDPTLIGYGVGLDIVREVDDSAGAVVVTG